MDRTSSQNIALRRQFEALKNSDRFEIEKFCFLEQFALFRHENHQLFDAMNCHHFVHTGEDVLRNTCANGTLVNKSTKNN